MSEEAILKYSSLYKVHTYELFRVAEEDDVCEVFETVSRWIGFMDDNLIKLKDVQNAIEEKTGVKLKGWV